jgi:hypothetical protein
MANLLSNVIQAKYGGFWVILPLIAKRVKNYSGGLDTRGEITANLWE